MKRPFFALWILTLCLFVFSWIYLPGLSHYRDLKARQEEIEKEILDLDTKLKSVKEERDLMKNDVEYLEKVIRDELGLVKPGEVVYKFVQDQPKKVAESAPEDDKSAATEGGEAASPAKPLPLVVPAKPVHKAVSAAAASAGIKAAPVDNASKAPNSDDLTPVSINEINRTGNAAGSSALRSALNSSELSAASRKREASVDAGVEPVYPRQETR